MLTRCPQCATAFRVTPEQLKARHGKVRCGACQAVFNAIDTLIEETIVVVPPAATPNTGIEHSQAQPAPDEAGQVTAPITPDEPNADDPESPSAPEIPPASAELPEEPANAGLPDSEAGLDSSAESGESPLTERVAEPETIVATEVSQPSGSEPRSPFVLEAANDEIEPATETLSTAELLIDDQADSTPDEAPTASDAGDEVADEVAGETEDEISHRDVLPPLADSFDPLRGSADLAPDVPPPTEVSAAEPASPEDGLNPPLDGSPSDKASEFFTPPNPLYEPALHVAAPATRKRNWLWGLGLVFALTLLSLQMVIALRTEVATIHPQMKPALVSLCEMFACQVSLPRKVDLVGIDSSDLLPSPEGGNRLVLVATLRNRAPFAQEFPHLELTLTDTGDTPLVRRVLAPADYLSPKTPFADGFPPNTDLPVNLSIAADGIPAAGYRLYLFYP